MEKIDSQDIIEEKEFNKKDDFVQVIQPNIKILSDEEVTDSKDRYQFKEEVVQAYANMIRKDIKVNLDCCNFVEFIEKGYLYVDNSLFIKMILMENNDSMITCPKKLGKSMNFSMLKAFLQPDGDDEAHYQNGKYDFSRGNKNLVLFEGGERILESEEKRTKITFKSLKIAEEIDYMNKYQGQYPVIFLNLKSVNLDDAKTDNNEYITDLDEKLREAISDSYMEHEYLMRWIKNNNRYKTHDINKFEAYLLQNKEYISYRNHASYAELNDSMIFLAELLFEYYKKSVFILVDEFDKPVNTFLSKGDNILDNIKGADKIARIISSIIDPCCENSKIKLIKLIGTLNSQIISESMDRFYEDEVVTWYSGGPYGFNEEDVNFVLDQVFEFNKNTSYKKLLFDKFKEWVYGQILGKAKVFAPLSIMEYLSNLIKFSNKQLQIKPKFREYFEITETTRILEGFITTARNRGYGKVLLKLALLSIKNIVEFKYDSKIRLMCIIYSMLHQNEIDESNFEKLVFYYLSRSGYITKIKGKQNQYKLSSRDVDCIYFKNVVNVWKKEIYKDEDKFIEIVKDIDFSTYSEEDVNNKINNALTHVKINYLTLNENIVRIVLQEAMKYSRVKSKHIDVELQSCSNRVALIYYYDRVVNLYVLKFVNYESDSYFNEMLILEKYQKLNVETIKIIPVVLFGDCENKKWKYKTGNIQIFHRNDAKKEAKIVEIVKNKQTNNLITENRIDSSIDSGLIQGDNSKDREFKISKHELISKINKSKYNLKDIIIEKLKNNNKEIFTKKEALKAINIKTKNARGNILIEDIYKNNPVKQSKKKRGFIDELTLKTSSNLTYYSQDLDWILKQRILEEQLSDKVLQLDTHKSYEYQDVRDNISNLLSRVKEKLINPDDVVLVPIAEEEHFIGLVFKTSKEHEFILNYLDSENMEIEEDLKEELLKRNVKINIIQTNNQLYEDNCGIETVENLIGYLKGEDLLNRRICQEEAIQIHTKLIEFKNSNNTNEEDVKLKEIMELFKKLEIKAHKKRPLKEFISLNETKEMPYLLLKKRLREEYSNIN